MRHLPGTGLRIGLSACFFHADPKRPVFKGKTLQYLEQSMAQWAMSQGALAFMIPEPAGKSPTQLPDLVAAMDGLILQGGSDVCPRSYGEEALKPEWNGDFVRDQYEIALIREFMRQGKPVLGICRGAQVLNVAFGGTLYQDIATQVPGARNHRDWEIYDQNFHEIAFEPGSGLAKLYAGAKTAKTNTVHHQALKDLGKDLAVEARCPEDGIVEAVRLKGQSYAFGVQWHPEFHDPSDKSLLDGAPILTEFLNATRAAKR